MGLIVPVWEFIADIVLFLVLGYAAIYALTRVSRYSDPFHRFIMITAFSLLIATVGRAMDIADDFSGAPSILPKLEVVLYFVSIIGVIYGLVNYIGSIEGRLLVVPSKIQQNGGITPGGFLYFGDRDSLLNFLASVDVPILAVTRTPWAFERIKNVKTLWVTQASEEGVSPTKLHVIIDTAVKFFKSGGKLILIDCLEVLILYNDFVSVFKFLTTLKDYALNTGGTVLVNVSEDTLEEREINLLTREFEPVRDLKRLLKPKTFS
ncbi:DUF835 domain-containing protein [Thermococcus sp.]